MLAASSEVIFRHYVNTLYNNSKIVFKIHVTQVEQKSGTIVPSFSLSQSSLGHFRPTKNSASSFIYIY